MIRDTAQPTFQSEAKPPLTKDSDLTHYPPSDPRSSPSVPILDFERVGNHTTPESVDGTRHRRQSTAQLLSQPRWLIPRLLLILMLILQSIVIKGFLLSRWISNPFGSGGDVRIFFAHIAILVIAASFAVLIAIDSLLNQNIAQLIALCIFNVSMGAYGACLFGQSEGTKGDNNELSGFMNNNNGLSGTINNNNGPFGTGGENNGLSGFMSGNNGLSGIMNGNNGLSETMKKADGLFGTMNGNNGLSGTVNANNGLSSTFFQLRSGSPSNLTNWQLPVMITIIAICSIILFGLTWHFYKEFGWDMFKRLGGDIRLKKALRMKNFFFMLLKFNLFFLSGFRVQNIVLSMFNTGLFIQNVWLSPIASLTSLLVLLSAVIGVEYELKWIMCFYYPISTGTGILLAYEVYRIYSNVVESHNEASFILFTSLTLGLFLAGVIFSIPCSRNFGIGLKEAPGLPSAWLALLRCRPCREARVPASKNESEVPLILD